MFFFLSANVNCQYGLFFVIGDSLLLILVIVIVVFLIQVEVD